MNHSTLDRTRIDLSGRTALVMGSAPGMGYTIATRFAEAGAAVVLHGRTAAGWKRRAHVCPRVFPAHR
jgi:NAD(P)-dependent dehydrogenase (short-subunit alcohol dehydrogenase family)